MAFGLFDSFMKSQKLKDNLGTEALKGFRKESSSKTSKGDSLASGSTISSASQLISKNKKLQQQASHSMSMLHKLISEADHKFVVFSDDLSSQTKEQQLKGLQACQDNDVLHYNWFISLVNSQA